MFRQPGFVSRYFTGQEGTAVWENFIGESRTKRAARMEELGRQARPSEEQKAALAKNRVIFEELEFEPDPVEMPVKKKVTFFEEIEEEPQKSGEANVLLEEFDEDDFSGISFEEIGEEELSEELFAPATVMAQVEETAAAPVVQRSNRTEEMLFELMGKFSYESMLSEIRRTVRAEMEREAEARETQAAMPMMPAATSVPVEPAVQEAFVASIAPVEAAVPEGSVAPIAPVGPAVPEVPVELIIPEEFAIPEVPMEPPVSVEPEMPIVDIPAEEDLFGEFPMLEGIDFEEADEMALRMAEEIRAEEQKAEEAVAEEAEPVFDIMQLLAAEAEKLANVSAIDMMDTYGELVIEITLEELVHYNNARRSKRGVK